MNDDVRKYIYTALNIFVLVLVTWIGFLYISSCGFTFTCERGAFAVERTPIPTLLPATLPALPTGDGAAVVSDQCHAAAVDFIGAWVTAGSPEADAFQFTDINGQNCESTFEEVKPLFTEANFWYSNSLSCVSCHSVDVIISPAQLDLSSYTGLISGSRRPDMDSEGTDILGAGNWESSLLYEFISTTKADIPGHAEIAPDLMIYAGTPLPAPDLTATPIPEEIPSATPTP